MRSPTAYLPPIKSLNTISPSKLQEYVGYLRSLYNPPVRGSRRRKSSFKPDEQLEIHNDAFERKYAIQWLTVLLSTYDYEHGGFQDSEYDHIASSREALIESAASLLAICAGTAAAGVVMRTFEFETRARDHAAVFKVLKIHLTDVPLDNHDYGSVGAQTWGGACILAEMMAEAPNKFGMPKSYSDTQFRCLELGAGTGLVSLTAGKIIESELQLLSAKEIRRFGHFEVVATDYYPSVLANLNSNIQANFGTSIFGDHLHIEAQALDWAKFPTLDAKPVALQQPFDVVYGADIIYEEEHAKWIKNCLETLLKKPGHMDPEPSFHLIIPLRHTHTMESSSIERVFEREKVQSCRQPQMDTVEKLVLKASERIICDIDNGDDEIEYAYYRIGWQI